MSNQRQREDFIARLAKHNIPPDDARKLLRYARTLHRLAEAQCNGDGPYVTGKVCPFCKGEWAKSSVTKHGGCPDCRTKRLARNLVAFLRDTIPLPGFAPEFSGDPRGYVLKLRLPGDPGGIDGFVGVP